MAVLHNWVVMSGGLAVFLPHPLTDLRLHGGVYDHPTERHEDGKMVFTSPIVEVKGRILKTKNTTYRLGRIDKAYLKIIKQRNHSWDWRNPLGKERKICTM